MSSFMHAGRSSQPPQDHASGPSSSNTARQRSDSPVRPSSGRASATPSTSTQQYDQRRALSMLHNDSPNADLPSPAKRPKPSYPPSSIPTSTIVIDSESEDDDFEISQEDNDENAPPNGEAENMMMEGEGEPMDMEEDEEEIEIEEGIDREEGEGDSEEDLEDEEDEDDEDEEEEEEEDEDDARSLDLEVEFVSQRQGSGPPKEGQIFVKSEPGEPKEAGPSTLPDGAIADAGAVINTLVAKKKKQVRAIREPSVERPPAPPLDTIRLSHSLNSNGTTLEWDVLASAEAQGLIMRRWNVVAHIEVVIPKKEVAVENANGDGDGILNPASSSAGPKETPEEKMARELDEKYNDKPKKIIRRKKKLLEYDVADEFIDDSELQQDAPTHMARTVKKGFFVAEGKVEVMEEEAKPATRARATGIRKAPRASQASGVKRKSLAQLVREGEKKKMKKGSAMTPIKIDSDDEDEPGSVSPFQRSPSPEFIGSQEEAILESLPPVNRVRNTNAPKDPALLPPWPDFPKDVRLALADLYKQSDAYPWDLKDKGRFPERIKEPLEVCGIAAIRHEIFPLSEAGDARFFSALPSLLPYNTFTLTKLTTKLCFQFYCEWLDQCEKAGLKQFGALVKRDAGEWKRKYSAALKRYEEDKRVWEEKHGKVPNDPVSSSLAAPTSTNMTLDSSLEHPDREDVDDRPSALADGEAPKEPQKKFFWAPEMREVFEQLLDNLELGLELTARAVVFRMSTNRVGKEWTETAMRAILYKKIIDLFPEGYMGGQQVSREMSKIKSNKKRSLAMAVAATE